MDETERPLSERDRQAFRHVPIEVRVSVGRAWPRIDELLHLGAESILVLDKTIEDPVDLFIGNRLIARGHLEEVEGDGARKIAVRLVEVARDGEGL